jgi:hypothetical protein
VLGEYLAGEVLRFGHVLFLLYFRTRARANGMRGLLGYT